MIKNVQKGVGLDCGAPVLFELFPCPLISGFTAACPYLDVLENSFSCSGILLHFTLLQLLLLWVLP